MCRCSSARRRSTRSSRSSLATARATATATATARVAVAPVAGAARGGPSAQRDGALGGARHERRVLREHAGRVAVLGRLVGVDALRDLVVVERDVDAAGVGVGRGLVAGADGGGRG